jgi:hypothetical protein
VSGYFGPHEQRGVEPIYRNLFRYARDFGDAELAALIAPTAARRRARGSPGVDEPAAQ